MKHYNFEGVKYTHWLRDAIIDWFKGYIVDVHPWRKRDDIEITVEHPYNKEFLYQNAVITIKEKVNCDGKGNFKYIEMYNDMKNIMMIKLSEQYGTIINMDYLKDGNNYVLTDRDLFCYIKMWSSTSNVDDLFRYFVPNLKHTYHYKGNY